MNVKGKTAIVTGAAQGIGRTIALLLARAEQLWWRLTSRQELAESCRRDCGAGARVPGLRGKCGQPPTAKQLIKGPIDAFGKIDILVNNAGITRDTVLLRMKEEQWDQVIAVNLKGTFNCTKAALRYMFRQNTAALSIYHP